MYTIWHNESFGEFYPVYNGKKSERNSQETDTVNGRLGVKSAIESLVGNAMG